MRLCYAKTFGFESYLRILHKFLLYASIQNVRVTSFTWKTFFLTRQINPIFPLRLSKSLTPPYLPFSYLPSLCPIKTNNFAYKLLKYAWGSRLPCLRHLHSSIRPNVLISFCKKKRKTNFRRIMFP
jgi:hypothetical protein